MSQSPNADLMTQMLLQNAPKTAHEMRRMLEAFAPILNADLPAVGAFHDAVLAYGGIPTSLARWGLGVDG